jgi:hypothetical protein
MQSGSGCDDEMNHLEGVASPCNLRPMTAVVLMMSDMLNKGQWVG